MTAPTLADMIALVVLSERRTIERALQRAGVAAEDIPDVEQDVLVFAVQAAQDGRLRWEDRAARIRWLYVVALRRGIAHVRRVELRARYERTHDTERLAPSAEDRYLVRETLRIAATSTTPERWRCLRGWANGVPLAAIARREGLTPPGVYSRIERARRDIRAAFRRR